MQTALTCAFTQWRPDLGDSHFVGWLTVGVYLSAAIAAWLVARRLIDRDSAALRERWFWRITAGLMLLLAINKQLDLQSLLTVFVRCHAQLSGWYDNRRALQVVFIYLVAAGGVLSLALSAVLLRGLLSRVGLALAGLGFVCVFVVIRAASFHHVDVFLGSTAVGIKLSWLLELPGPTLVALVALRRRSGI
ncbi:MAG: isopropylmalate isomerase [Tabrizicola sp.]